MKMDYRRDLQHNYLVAETPEDTDNYIVRMITENQIRGLLSCECKRMDQNRLYYYDITSRLSLAEKCRYKKITGTEVLRVLRGLLQTMVQLEEYLIPEKQICLDWNYIYLDPANGQPYFCCLPLAQKEPEQGIRELLEELLPRLDHQEREGVSVVYEVYQYAMQDSFSVMELQGILEQRMLELQNLSPEEQIITGEREHKEQKSRYGGREETEKKSVQIIPEPPNREHKEDNEQNWMGKGNYERALNDFFSDEDEESDESEKRNFPMNVIAYLLGGVLYLVTGYVVWKYAAEYFGIWGAFGVIIALGILIWKVIIKRRQKEECQIEEQFAFYQRKPDEKAGVFTNDAEEKWEDTEEENEKITAWEERNSGEEKNYTQMLTMGKDRDRLVLMELYPMKGRQFAIQSDQPVIIGQLKAQADLVLPSSAVSRVHASIEKRMGNWYIKDLNSRNGTWVNEQELYGEEEQELSDGDQIRFADLLYQVRLQSF